MEDDDQIQGHHPGLVAVNVNMIGSKMSSKREVSWNRMTLIICVHIDISVSID